jgi:hydroxysqualene dehydroxylase
MTAAASHTRNGSRRVVVVGGGLAGIAAAVRLADAGVAVTLVETRQRLGGRATSFVDPQSGLVLDNCQHVLLGCCTNLLDLYQRLGVRDRIRWHRRLLFTDSAGRIDVLEADDLPAPFHLTMSLLGFAGLTWREKLAIARGMFALIRLGRTGRDAWHDRTFSQWLRLHRQPDGVIEKFWAVIIISALNETPDRVAAHHAMQVFQEGFLAHADAYAMGVSAVPLLQLYDAAQHAIERAGGTVMLATSAERIAFDAQRRHVTGLHIAGDRFLEADALLSAVPFDRLAKLCPPTLRDAEPRLAGLEKIDVSPIIGIHLWLARDDGQPAMPLPHLIFMQSPLQWVFNKGPEPFAQRGREPFSSPAPTTGTTAEMTPVPFLAGAQHVHGVISAAREWVDQPAEAIAAMAVKELRKVLPTARSAKLVHHRVVKEKRATFAAVPGFEALRPSAAGAVGNFLIAGDWADTGWPATMEGAARSGHLAAAAAMHHLHITPPPGTTPTGLVDDLEPSAMYRLFAG